MKLTILGLALLALATPPVHAQGYRYSATTGDVVLAGAGTKLTIQQPATNGKQVTLEAAILYCSVACDVTQAQNGAAATATAGTANGLIPFGPPASATVWTASNVGSGAASGGILHLAAGERLTLDLTKIRMGNTGATNNYTLVVSTITGTANLTLFWSEN